MRSHEVLAAPSKLLDLPDKGRLVWRVLYSACRRLKKLSALNYNVDPLTYSEFRCIGVIWHGNIDLNVVRCTSPLELRFDLDHVFDTGAFVMFNLSIYRSVKTPVISGKMYVQQPRPRRGASRVC